MSLWLWSSFHSASQNVNHFITFQPQCIVPGFLIDQRKVVHILIQPPSQCSVEPPFAADSTASLLGFSSISFGHTRSETAFFAKQLKLSQTAWKASCKQQFSPLPTDSQLILALNFNWTLLTD
ncbi:hypothetical protein XENOCAPTIV_024183 [Xenoophorus captivus]|uniref:Uncharacterized protein n=1 Tax=Xenoophorus captivus TaxID=1517983 RepID=A0ABV0R214_9TELE